MKTQVRFPKFVYIFGTILFSFGLLVLGSVPLSLATSAQAEANALVGDTTTSEVSFTGLPGDVDSFGKATLLSYCTLPLCLDWSPNERDNTESVAWGDYDGDGDLDLAVGNSLDQPNRLYRNDDGILTSSAIWSSTEIDVTYDVAWGDYDGDGDLDLAVGNAYTQTNRLYRNDNGVLTSSAVWSSDESDFTYSVAWGDYDGDGDLDLAVGNALNQPNRLYRNDNGMLSEGAVWSSDESDFTYSVAWGDYDGDGDLDLAVGNYGPNRLYRNDDGVLTNNAIWSSTWSATECVAWGDYDGDGDPDLAVGNGNYPGQPNQLYRNDNGMLTSNPIWSSDESDHTTSLAWGDYDGDGDLDLTVGNGYNDTPNRLYRNDEGVLTGSAVWSSTESDATDSVAWGDYDGDGDLDLAVGNGRQPNRLYRNEIGMLTSGAIYSSTESDETYSIAWGDVDGDGDLDLAVGNAEAQSNRLYRNDDGVLTDSAVWSSTEIDITNDVAWGDYDGDGDLDLAVGNEGPNRLYRNDDGVLTSSAVWYSTEIDATDSVAWGDYDGDGDLDLVVGNVFQPNRLYRNDNGMLTSNAVWSSVESDYTTSIAWGDVDGDGDLDLVVGSVRSYQPNRLYRNDAGMLTDTAIWSSTESDFTSSVAWGDVDGDGDLDLAVGNVFQPNRLYRNDAGALTSSAVWSSIDYDVTDSLAWGDYDGDGDLDLAVGNEGPNRLYRNDNGTLMGSAVWSSTEEDFTFSVAWGDYDVDGDLDLAVGNRGLNRLYHNPRQHPNAALPANPLTLVIQQPGGQPAANYYAQDGYIDDQVIPITYTLYSRDYNSVSQVQAQYSLDGGGQWIPAMTPNMTSNPNTVLRFDGLDDFVAIPDSDEINLGEHPQITAMAWFNVNDAAITSTKQVIYEQGGGAGGLNMYVYDGKIYAGAWAENLSWSGAYISSPISSGQWHHVAVVISGTNSLAPDALRVYLDGQEIGSENGTGLPQHNGDIAIGKVRGNTQLHDGDVSDGNWFAGSIDEVQIWQTALTKEQIHTAMKQKVDISDPLLGAYWRFNEGQGTLAVDSSSYHNDGLLGDGVSGEAPAWFAESLPYTGGDFTFLWDTFASNFFGQSDNVVLRFVTHPQPAENAAPGTYKYFDRVPGPFQWSYASASTFPFRVRGTQVRVYREAQTPGNEAPGAIVYRLPAGWLTGGDPLADQAGIAYRTDGEGYLQGRGLLSLGDTLFALLPISTTQRYTLYATNGIPLTDTLAGYVVQQPGAQNIIVSMDHPLLLFNLDVSLEWDARADGDFLTNLEQAFQKASAHLYDVSDGQIAIGNVNLYQDKENWLSSDIVIYAQSGIRPRASMGGMTDELLDDEYWNGEVISNAYGPGQIRMGPNWDPFGSNLTELSVDWQRALAHELSHYLLFLPDNYIGVEDNKPVSVDCQGSFMTNTYDDAYSEFLTSAEWTGDCLNTIAENTTGRTDWETVRRFYDSLVEPLDLNVGPSNLPLNVTQLIRHDPTESVDTFGPTYFDLRDASSGVLLAVPRAQGYLFKRNGTPADLTDDRVLLLGSSLGSGDRLKVRGAEQGDQVCVVGPYQEVLTGAYLGCQEILDQTTRSIPIGVADHWQPNIVASSVSSTTFQITATLPLSAGVSALNTQFFPAYGAPDETQVPTPWEAMTLHSSDGEMVFVATLVLDEPVFEGVVRVWADGQPEKQALNQVYLSPPWGPPTRSGSFGGNRRAWGANSRQMGAPAASGDGQVTIFNLEDIFADTGTVSLQALNNLPNLPTWMTPVGQGYRFVSDADFPLAITFDYLPREVPDGYEYTLNLYYSPDEGASWQRLATDLDIDNNRATAVMPDNALNGQGIYTLIATLEMPVLYEGWNLFPYPIPESHPVTETLGSIAGKYTSVYYQDWSPEPNPAGWWLYDATVESDHPEFADLVNNLPLMEPNQVYWLYATEMITPYLGVPAGDAALLNSLNLELPPTTYYGWVQPYGSFAPAVGDLVSAWIDGILCGQGTLTEMLGALVHKIQVVADTGNGCGADGRQVLFQVGETILVFNTVVWNNQQAWFHVLGPPNSIIYIPLANK